MKFFTSITVFLLFLTIHPSFGENSVSFAVIGDAGHPSVHTNVIKESIKSSGVKNLILPGDNIYDLSLSYDDVWGSWNEFNFSVVALGNHHQSYEEEIEYFKIPNEYFSKVFKGIKFIVLNSDNKLNVDEQVSFLEKELKFSSGDQPLFVVFHHPPATVSYRHSWQEREEFQNAIRPILLRYRHKIDAILVGHDHQASMFTYGNIPVIVSGAIFEYFPSRYVDQVIDGVTAQSIWRFESGYYWTRLDVDKKNNWTWVNFINGYEDKVVCSIKLTKNKEVIVRPNCKK